MNFHTIEKPVEELVPGDRFLHPLGTLAGEVSKNTFTPARGYYEEGYTLDYFDPQGHHHQEGTIERGTLIPVVVSSEKNLTGDNPLG